MAINSDLPQPSESDLLKTNFSSAQLIRNQLLYVDSSSSDMAMKTRLHTFNQSIYVDTTDINVEKRLPNLNHIEGVFVSVGNPWRLFTQSLALGRCDGVIMLDHHPMQTEVLLPLFVHALQKVPFAQDRNEYIRTISKHIRRDLPQLITDIQLKYPELFAVVKKFTSYRANYDPDELQGQIQISLENDFGTFGDNFVLASKKNIQQVHEWFQIGKIISATADLTDHRVGAALSSCLTELHQTSIAAIDISNCADHDPKLLVDNLQRQKTLKNSIILYSGLSTGPNGLRASIATDISHLRTKLIKS